MKFSVVEHRRDNVRYDQLSDVELVDLLRSGDHGAFTALYNKYAQELAEVLYRYIKDEELLENALQNVFMKLWEDRESLVEMSNVKGYLYRSVKNNIINTIKRNVNGMKKAYEVAQADYTDPVSVDLERREEVEIVTKGISTLPITMQKIIECKREGLTNDEISKKMNMPIATVAVYYSRSIKMLRKIFTKGYILIAFLFVLLMN